MQVSAQTKVRTDSTGNYRVVYQKSDSAKGEPTGKYLIVKDGTKYPVYLGANGRFYVIRTSKKTGKQYKQYIVVTN